MAQISRTRGYEGELEVLSWLRSQGVDTRRVPRGHGYDLQDLQDKDHIFEVKSCKEPGFASALPFQELLLCLNNPKWELIFNRNRKNPLRQAFDRFDRVTALGFMRIHAGSCTYVSGREIKKVRAMDPGDIIDSRIREIDFAVENLCDAREKLECLREQRQDEKGSR